MTEEEWFNCADPQPMLGHLRRNQPSDRKLRLFGAAICRRHCEQFADECSKRVVEANEQFAEGVIPWVELSATLTSMESALGWRRRIVLGFATGDTRRLAGAIVELGQRFFE